MHNRFQSPETIVSITSAQHSPEMERYRRREIPTDQFHNNIYEYWDEYITGCSESNASFSFSGLQTEIQQAVYTISADVLYWVCRKYVQSHEEHNDSCFQTWTNRNFSIG